MIIQYAIRGCFFGIMSTVLLGQTKAMAELQVTPVDHYAEVLDQNRRGDLLVQREVADTPFSTSLATFIHPAGQKDAARLPCPPNFTSVSFFHISDTAKVIGFATRPLGNPKGNQRAFLWDWTEQQFTELPVPKTFRGSCAFDLSANGKTVCGFILGASPARITPCVWQHSEKGWNCQLLPCPSAYNPFLTTGRLAISSDGQVIAGSVTVSEEPVRKSQLVLWKQDSSGQWKEEVIAHYAVRLGDVNNQGVVVGSITVRGGKRIGLVVAPNAEPFLVEPLQGDASLEFLGINNRGEVVGNSDDPPGPEGGTVAIQWNLREQQLQAIDFGRPTLFSTATTIKDRGAVGGWVSWLEENEFKSGSYLLTAPPQDNLPQAP